jgi:UDP-N-acetyl-D-mannosaminuronate dehydrogenase
VSYHDPYVPAWQPDVDVLTTVGDLGEALTTADVVVLLQSHAGYALADIADKATRILDTRGVLPGSAVTRL